MYILFTRSSSTFILSLVLHLFHFISVPWPFRRRPLPHRDSPPSLAFGWVTDAERSFDIVPVSQRFVHYHSYHLGSLMFILNFSLIIENNPPFNIDNNTLSVNDSLLCSSELQHGVCWISLLLYSRERLESRGQAQRRQAGLWPWELWVKEDGAQQERSILI